RLLPRPSTALPIPPAHPLSLHDALPISPPSCSPQETSAPSPPLATWPLTPVLPRSRDDLGPRFAVNSRLGLAINSSRMPSSDRHGWPRATTPHPRPTTIANALKERNTTPR